MPSASTSASQLSAANLSGMNGSMADTDEEEPVNKVRRMGVGGGRMEDGGIPRLVDLFASPSFSPAATLLRY